IEKHFTLDKNMEGPDHKASLEPEELRSMVKAIRDVEMALGSGIKMFTKSEMDTMAVARKSIVASVDIKEGQIIGMDDLEYKRPGNGLSPKYYKMVLGKKARKEIKQDEQITLDLIQN
ncbi:MAG: N-acetylneuraminate synthase family protein, partial [Clostridium sp.]|nr:N-acetylneuraminate synthase family protein [Clostridium sp.]